MRKSRSPLSPQKAILAFCFFLPLNAFFSSCSPGTRLAHSHPIERSLPINSPAFKKQLETTMHARWHQGNQITTLVNGDEFYPAMLSSIRSAKKTITFETYAFVKGGIAQCFINAFCKKAKEGVKVHLIFDSIGSIDFGKNNLAKLKRAGIAFKFYHPYTLFSPLRYLTRDHRKIMVIDGKVAFTGGCGVADAWIGDALSPSEWRENHYRIKGPVVKDLQRAFINNWTKLGGSPLTGPDYFPSLTRRGNINAQAFISSPEKKSFTIPHLYRQVIASARKSIVIENSYFLPDHSIMREIIKARKRGVHVEIIVPGKFIDAGLVQNLARAYYKKLLKYGVIIYEYQQTMLHCKVLVIDDYFTSIGSANFDPRSMYINDEANVNILNTSFASEQLRIIQNDKRHSIQITSPPSIRTPLTLPKRILAQIIAPQL